MQTSVYGLDYVTCATALARSTYRFWDRLSSLRWRGPSEKNGRLKWTKRGRICGRPRARWCLRCVCMYEYMCVCIDYVWWQYVVVADLVQDNAWGVHVWVYVCMYDGNMLWQASCKMMLGVCMYVCVSICVYVLIMYDGSTLWQAACKMMLGVRVYVCMSLLHTYIHTYIHTDDRRSRKTRRGGPPIVGGRKIANHMP